MKVFLGEGVEVLHSLIFDMSPAWEIVSDTNLADALIIVNNNGDNLEPIRRHYRPHQVLVIQEIFHMSENMSYEFYCKTVKDKFKSITTKVIIIHNNLSWRSSPGIVYYDHIFDRQKLHSTDYDTGILLDKRVWTSCCSKGMYELHPINKILGKKYLALMRVYHHTIPDMPARMKVRIRIRSLLNKYDTYMCDDHSALFLPNDTNDNVTMYTRSQSGGVWYPVSNKYYDSSIVSVYTETLVEHSYHNSPKNLASIVTEKTMDPMIRGNFVLPFGYPGLIKDITDIYGFKLPGWIDYSYDNVVDDVARLTAYERSLGKLDAIPLAVMHRLCIRDLHILEHNRSIFFSRPYDFLSLHEKVKACIAVNEAAGWDLPCLKLA